MNPIRTISILALLVLGATASAMTPAELARAIDSRLAAFHATGGITPAPRSDDDEFLRRIHLDLTGVIPTVSEVRSFLADGSPDKRARRIDLLMKSAAHKADAARVWRSLLVPQATSNPQTQQLGVSVEAWVRVQLRDGAKDDQIVRKLLTARLDYLAWTPDGKPDPGSGLSPVGFYQANDLKPETVGSAVSRTFMGLKLECALCHDHPFDKWTQTQAWETAAFFASVAPMEPKIAFDPKLASRRTLTITETKTTVSAKVLSGESNANADPRTEFADWLTAKDNPYFARVMANRIWANLTGTGLVDPVDDWGPHNKPSHPELLDLLAKAYADGGFDADYLTKAIVLSETYQRTSRTTHESQADIRHYARMKVKSLSAESLFDSLALATGFREEAPRSADAAFGWSARSPRGLFIAKFGGGAGRSDMQVSILQALMLLNGEWIAEQTSPSGATVTAVSKAPFLDDAGRIETLFLATLSRLPTPAEATRYRDYFTRTDDKAQAVGDILWVLLNSQEFLVNR